MGVVVLLLVALALGYSIWRQKQLQRQLKMLANTDDLTGLLNRRRVFELGRIELSRALRYQQQMSLLVLDLDYFKAINDRYGHPVGDEVLRQVSIFLKDEIRDVDILGRVGGEEFVVVLPHTASDRASEMANRLTVSLTKLDLSSCNVAESISMSIGVAWLHSEDDDFQMIIKRADAALYQAKAAGRNTVKLQSETSNKDQA